MSSKEDAVKKAEILFIPSQLEVVGQNFYRYVEPISEDMISRKGLEREASREVNKPLTLIVRHDIENNVKLRSTLRVAVLQVTEDYEREQERALSSRTAKLQAKYAK